ncbi:MAG: tetratricopeptide (TPR) repeat protein, partial [Polyangiales bacterium]
MKRAFILIGALTAFVSPAQAQEASEAEPPVEPTAEATEEALATRQHNAGAVASGDGDFVLAEQEFRASLALRFRPSTAIDHAYSLEQLGRYGEAVRLYERLLGLAEAELPAEHGRGALERYRLGAREQQATVRVVVRGVAEARIVLDDVTMGRALEGHTVTLTVDPGEHRVAAVLDDREARSAIQLRVGEARDVELRFAPAPAEVAAAAEPDVEFAEGARDDQRRADARSNVVYWILG